jgi:hypothetical protein
MNVSTFVKNYCLPFRGNINTNNCKKLWEQHKKDNNLGDVTTSEKDFISRSGLDSGISSSSEFSARDFVKDLVSANEYQEYYPSSEETNIRVEDIYQTVMEKTGEIKDFQQILNVIAEKSAQQVVSHYKEQSALLSQINTQLGMSGDLSKDFRDEITEASPDLIRMRISFSEMASFVTQLVSDSGRFRLINQETIIESAKVAKAYVGSLSELAAMYPAFEKVGMGVSDTSAALIKAGRDAMGLGLRSQTVTKEIAANISKLNEFGFKNGVEGLSKMVRQSIEFRMNMENVFKIAEDIMDPEKALSLAANLQAVGGAVGSFNDPMKMMYMATNNVEGIGDALKEAASSLATYNSEQGRFEITGINLRRARAMASELGIAMGDLTKMAIASSEKMSALDDIAARGLTLTDDQKEFITNMAQMKDGRMVIELNSETLKKELGIEGTYLALETLTSDQAALITKYQDQLKSKTTEDLIRGQASNVANLTANVNFMAQLARIRAGKLGEKTWEAAVDGIAKTITGKELSGEKLNEDLSGWMDIQKKSSRGISEEIVDEFGGFIKTAKDTAKETINGVLNNIKEPKTKTEKAEPKNPNTNPPVKKQPDSAKPDTAFSNKTPLDIKKQKNNEPEYAQIYPTLINPQLDNIPKTIAKVESIISQNLISQVNTYNKTENINTSKTRTEIQDNKYITFRHELRLFSSALDELSRNMIKDPIFSTGFKEIMKKEERGYI